LDRLQLCRRGFHGRRFRAWKRGFAFLFFLKPEAGKYEGEGRGDRSATEAAKNELSNMTSAEFLALLTATKEAPNSR
jgi:hypothetical protein